MDRIEQPAQDFTPKYYKVKQLLISNIQKGQYQPHSKLPSEKELKQEYGISCTTAQRIRHELVNAGVAYAIQGKGCFVAGPVPETAARPQVKKHESEDKRLAFIATDSLNEFFSPILRGVLDVAQAKGYMLEILSSGRSYLEEKALLTKYLKTPIAGLLLQPSLSDQSYRHLFQLQKNEVKVVLMHRNIKNCKFDYVGINNVKGARDAVNQLIKKSHDKIVFISDYNLNSSSPALERLEGYKQALKEKKIKIDEKLILDKEYGDYAAREEVGYKKMKMFLPKGIEFSAVFAHNDEVALGAYKALKERKDKSLDNMVMVCFSDVGVIKNIEIPLIEVKTDLYQIGYQSAELLLKRIAGGSPAEAGKILIPPKLILQKRIVDKR
ncbi:MAG: hypothetical protein A2252_00020 [Elusimicrobia bacterium RIFOXYA2_FULL_39_19]|nr:MAG: hypothetical protein A2252_00020 [Elusimicrobia bacterium RIFOXYA2_FULL_39_19]